MATLQVTNLAQYGYVPDSAPSVLPPNAFSYVRNWRFNQAGYAEVTPGYSDAYEGVLEVNLGSSNTNATFFHSNTIGAEVSVFYYDLGNKRMRRGTIANNVFEESEVSTSDHVDDVEYSWQAAEAFGVPVFNNGLEAPWTYNATDDNLVTLTNWPDTTATCEFIASYSGFLIACGYEHSGASNSGERGGARVLAISDVIDEPGTLPDWNFSATDSFAQIFDLSLLTDGDIVSAYESSGVLYVNTTTNVIAFTYQGGGEFSATSLPFPNGVLTSKTTAIVPNGQFNIGNKKMYVHDGTNATPIGEGQFVGDVV